jgi:hypothetical protein
MGAELIIKYEGSDNEILKSIKPIIISKLEDPTANAHHLYEYIEQLKKVQV